MICIATDGLQSAIVQLLGVSAAYLRILNDEYQEGRNI